MQTREGCSVPWAAVGPVLPERSLRVKQAGKVKANQDFDSGTQTIELFIFSKRCFVNGLAASRLDLLYFTFQRAPRVTREKWVRSPTAQPTEPWRPLLSGGKAPNLASASAKPPPQAQPSLTSFLSCPVILHLVAIPVPSRTCMPQTYAFCLTSLVLKTSSLPSWRVCVLTRGPGTSTQKDRLAAQ